MATVKVIFHEILQDSQEFGSDNEHMVSRLFFSVEVNGQRFDQLYADIKQTVGSSYETAPLEMSSPRGGYRGPFDFEKFQSVAEQYYRKFIGSAGRFIGGSLAGVRSWNNRVRSPLVMEFEASGPDVAW
jgi:hypothetical protein